MKKVIFIFLLLLASIQAFAQLEVKPGSFHEVPGFVNINPDENYQFDDNDLPFAVIKVRTENITDKQRRDLRFESNLAVGILLEYKTGEVWVYVTAKYADYLKISHPDLSSIEFTIPFDLQPKKGYEMTLVNVTTPTTSGSGSLTVITKPEDGASITLNGKVLSQKTPYTNDMIAAGQYEITIKKNRYKSVTKLISIQNGDNQRVEIEMPIDVATITINVDALTDVYVDGKLMKRGTWSGELNSGQHTILGRKQYYRDDTRTITVEAGVPNSYNLNASPIYGKVSIKSVPSGSTVFIDDKEYGVTPLEVSDIMIGPHELKLSKDRWQTLKKQFVLEEGKVLTLNESLVNCPEGAINGLFSISPTQKVYFSKGNLQYQASTNTWRFAEHQWDYVGGTDFHGNVAGNVYEGGVRCDNHNVSPTYTGWIDLFYWGTGDNPTKRNRNLEEYDTFHDWGDNAISNGGNKEKFWRTMTSDEWGYLIDTRTTPSGMRYATAIVNGVKGLILLPDSWNKETYKLKKVNNTKANFSVNNISLSDWNDKFEANGAVFLPAAGAAIGPNNIELTNYFGGYYTPSTISYGKDDVQPNFFYFRDSSLGIAATGKYAKLEGRSVRLVCSAE